MKRTTLIKTGSAGVIFFAGIVALFVLGSTQPESKKEPAKAEVRSVQTQLLEFTDISLTVEGFGTVEPHRILTVTSEVSGKVVYAKNNLKNATFVSAGEVILKIDSKEIENNLYSLRSDFMNSIASILPEFKVENEVLYTKWNNYFRSIDLKNNLPELPEITGDYEKIKISGKTILTKYYNIINQEIILSKYEIRAPFSGFIESAGVLENSFVHSGKDLCKIKETGSLEIAIPLLVKEINLIDFSVSPYVKVVSKSSGKYKNGVIVRKEQLMDRNSQSVNVYVSFNNEDSDPEFLAGNYLMVEIKGKAVKNVASIPRNLLDNEGYILTMESGKLEREKVQVVAFQKDKAVISNTFEKDLRIVKTVLQKPLIGMEITSVNEPEANPKKVEMPQEKASNENTELKKASNL
ncbi:MAG: efflux RND transporter periplasmic adaptor subunit [Ignavibacteriaceae bacterium]|nr:efflux RND transporter periplasmic adaptor subunit [Ignavibacteriaceae bacterium]